MKTFEEIEENGILADHNIPTYMQLEKLFDSGEKRVGVVQATGTGKSYLAYQFLFDHVFEPNKKVDTSKEGAFTKDGRYKRKRAIVLEPTKAIAYRFKQLCEEQCREHFVPFDDVLVARYEQFMSLTDEELELLDYDYIILDEFHRLGAEVWGGLTKRLLDVNPNAKVLGMSATPFRYLDKRRNMGDELFGDNIVFGLNVADAIRRGVFPIPEYIISVRSYDETAKLIGDDIEKIKDKKTRELYRKELDKLRRHPEFAKGLKETFARKIHNKNGKFIAFCTDIERLQSLRGEIEKGLLSGVNKNVKIYQITFRDKKEDIERIIKEFEEDQSDSFKIMLTVDKFNEGVHIKDVDGCFLFRPTISPVIYTQQIGRVLSVRDDKDFQPQIFDIVGNLQSYEKILLAFEAERRDWAAGGNPNRDRNKTIIPFEITGSDEDLYNRLKNLYDQVSRTLTTKHQWLAAAERYVKEYKNLDVPQRYIEEETGKQLGAWIGRIRIKYNNDANSVDRDIVKKLSELDEHWSEYTQENSNSERDRKIIEGVRAWPRNKTIPSYATVSINGESFSLGSQINNIKYFVRWKEKGAKGRFTGVKYSQELIDEINKINPNVLKYREEKKIAERDRKIIEGVRTYIPIPKRKRVKINGKYFELGYHIENIKAFLRLRENGEVEKYDGPAYSQELIDEINKINPNALDTCEIIKPKAKLRERKNAERDRKIIEGVREWADLNGNRTIPQRTVIIIDGKSFKLGNQIAAIKLHMQGSKSARYSQELIDEINEINPNVLKRQSLTKTQSSTESSSKTREEARIERDRKIIEGVRAWTDLNGNVPIPTKTEITIDGKTFNLGKQIAQIKQYLNGTGDVRYSQELIDAIKEINPTVLKKQDLSKTREEANIERYNKILKGVRIWPKNAPIPYDAEVKINGEPFDLGTQILCMKQFIRGQGNSKYPQWLVVMVNKINPNALRYQRESNKTKNRDEK